MMHSRFHPATTALVLALAAGAALGQEVTLTRIIGNGDLLPNGETFGGGGKPAIDGDYVTMNASSPSGYRAIIAYHIPTGEIATLADTASISPTWGEAFKTFGNPSINNDVVVYPGAAPLLTSEWDGLYRTRVDQPGTIRVVIDEFFPEVRIPTLQAMNDLGVAYRDKGFAREPIYFTDFGGAIEPVATPGMPTPDGGAYIEMDPPVAGGDLVAFQCIAARNELPLWSAYVWNARTLESQLILQENQPVPGQPGKVFEYVYVADTDGERTLVSGRYGQLHDVYEAVYTWDGGNLEFVIDSDTPAPGGGTFEQVQPIAIDGDLILFVPGEFSTAPRGLYGMHIGGEPFLIFGRDQTIGGEFIIAASTTEVGLSGNRVLLTAALDRLGRTAFYVAEIDFDTCAADINGDGVLDFFDFLEFQNLFASGDPRADFDGSGSLDFFDFLAFQNAYAAGCP